MDSLTLAIVLGFVLVFIPGGHGFDAAMSRLNAAKRGAKMRVSSESTDSASSGSKSMVGGILDIKKTVFSRLKPVLPVIGFYAVMNLNIYGHGLLGSKNNKFLGGMTDFSTVTNRGSVTTIANEYLVAPAGVAPKARVVKAPQYGIDKGELAKIVDRVIITSPRVTPIATDEATGRIEFVQRTPIFNFPDVITVMPISLGPSSSTIAMHSYSIYGAGDLGVNSKRIKGWLAEIEKEVAEQASIKPLVNPAMSGVPML